MWLQIGMKNDNKYLLKRLSDLDKKMEELDQLIKDARMEIHDLVWQVVENRKRTV